MHGTGTRFRGTLLSAALVCAFAPLAAWAQSSMPKPGLSVIKTPAEDARPIDPSQALPKPPVFHLVAAPDASPEPAYDEQNDDEGYEPGYAGGYGGYGDYGYYDPGYRNGRGDHNGHDGHDGHNDHHPRPPRDPGNSVTVAVPPPGSHPKPIGPVQVKVAPPPRQPPPDRHPGNGIGNDPGNGNPHR
jgi:hypothetical protein